MRIALILALWALAAPAGAEVLTRTSGPLASTLSLEDRVKTHPEFARFLRVEAMAIRDDFELAAAEAAAEGAAGGQWRLEVRDQATLVSAAYASIIRAVTVEAGEPAVVTVEPLVWDAARADFARLDRFFEPGEARDEALIAIAHNLREGIRQIIWAGRIPDSRRVFIAQATTPDAIVLSNFTLAPSEEAGKSGGLTFHFNPGEVGEGRERPDRLTLPHRIFAPWLNAEGKALFSGAIKR